MKLSSVLASVAAAGSALAAPQGDYKPPPSQPQNPQTFGIMSLHSASPIHFGQFSAANGNLYIYLANQNATCDRPNVQWATFYIKDGSMYLYSKDKPVQEIYVDRSGMGQGKTGYTTGTYIPAPRNSERKTWTIDQTGDLTFNGAGLLACPSTTDNSWSIWVLSGVSPPAGLKGCLGMVARTINITDPASCEYTKPW
ncbi:hypothetical protein CDD82_3816 [Ophiocordyceps australis]|uniref:Cell wall protein PhiA n=1 Tax=Ophiocordyceps australis TaxID=1399860 RepID=A0A2C5ZV34_9HYPO|nr:hypothetical protein CDD82_3816 [Ophiocordyceps australis]